MNTRRIGFVRKRRDEFMLSLLKLVQAAKNIPEEHRSQEFQDAYLEARKKLASVSFSKD